MTLSKPQITWNETFVAEFEEISLNLSTGTDLEMWRFLSVTTNLDDISFLFLIPYNK
jgi:hypothetical protein